MAGRPLILAALLALLPMAARADLVVVVNPKSGIDRMTREEVVYVFMGRWRQLPSGLPAQPVDLPADSADYASFYRQLVNKNSAEIKAYWSRLIFSGGARPPVVAQGRDEQMKILASTPGAIGYLERSTVDSRVKVVFEFPTGAP